LNSLLSFLSNYPQKIFDRYTLNQDYQEVKRNSDWSIGMPEPGYDIIFFGVVLPWGPEIPAKRLKKFFSFEKELVTFLMVSADKRSTLPLCVLNKHPSQVLIEVQ
jgi:hypothetical protein